MIPLIVQIGAGHGGRWTSLRGGGRSPRTEVSPQTEGRKEPTTVDLLALLRDRAHAFLSIAERALPMTDQGTHPGTDPPWRPPVRDGGPAVACVGETMVSFTPTDGTNLDTAETVGLDIAGAESNVAMYLADHGLDARWVSRLGDDAFGRRVLHRVRTAGVDVSGVRTDPARPTGLLFKDPAENGSTRVSYYRQGSAASAMEPYLLDEEVMRTADVWHFTGITPALSVTCRELVEAALGGDWPAAVSFDVNHRPAVWGEAPGALAAPPGPGRRHSVCRTRRGTGAVGR